MEKITIRPLAQTDLNNLLVFANALSVENTFVQLSGEKITEQQEREFLAKRLSASENGNGMSLVCMIGTSFAGLGGIDRLPKRSAHVGRLNISIAKEFRGKGAGFALLTALLEHARSALQLRMVILHCFENNTAAIRLYEKVGFKKAGVVPEMLLRNGEYLGEITMYVPLV